MAFPQVNERKSTSSPSRHLVVIVSSVSFLACSCGVPLLADDQRETTAAMDAHQDSLPPGALMRLGTSWLRHRGGSEGAAFSADGKLLATCGWSDVVRLWDAATGAPAGTFVSKSGSNEWLNVAFCYSTLNTNPDLDAIRIVGAV